MFHLSVASQTEPERIWAFTWSVFSNWLVLLGGAVMIVLGVIERLRTKEVHWKLYVSIIIALLFGAFYMAWREQTLRLEVAQSIPPSQPAIKLDVTDVDARSKLEAATKRIETLESELTAARENAKQARDAALNAEIATRPKPFAERLRACLESIDPRITQQLMGKPSLLVNGRLDFRKVQELQKLAAEPGAEQFITIKANGFTGISAGENPLSGDYDIEVVIQHNVLEPSTPFPTPNQIPSPP
jgi:hypothetical protein